MRDKPTPKDVCGEASCDGKRRNNISLGPARKAVIKGTQTSKFTKGTPVTRILKGNEKYFGLAGVRYVGIDWIF